MKHWACNMLSPGDGFGASVTFLIFNTSHTQLSTLVNNWNRVCLFLIAELGLDINLSAVQYEWIQFCCVLVFFDFIVDHDNVNKWKHFPRYWPYVRGIHRSRWVPLTKAVTRRFAVFFDLPLNKWLSKQSRRRWFEVSLGSLWRHCNVYITAYGFVVFWFSVFYGRFNGVMWFLYQYPL